MTLSETTVSNTRGYKLYVRVYRPSGTIKGFVLFHHGYGAHTTLYDHVYQGWADQGLAVVAHDSQSFGRSKGDDPKHHAWVDDFQLWVDDVYQIRKEVLDPMQPPGTPLPVFMGGQSMGGTLTILTALRDQSAWQGILLISPAVDAQLDWLQTFLLKIQAIAFRLCPNARIVPSPPFDQCTDVPELITRFKTDPLMDQGPMRVRTGCAFMPAFVDCVKGSSQLTLPICVIASQTDKIISVKALHRFLKDVQSKDVTVHWVEHGWHELFLGPHQQEACAAASQWLQAHV